MQAFHLYVLLGKKIFPDIARQKTAALLDQFQPGLVSRLMNYEVVEGKKRTITGFPPVQFAHNQDGFSLVGFGETGSALLADISAPLATAWSDHLDVPVKLDSKVIGCSIDPRPYMLTYQVPRMVVQKRAEHLKTLGDASTGKTFLESLFLNSLRRQADFLGLKLPEGVKVNFIGAKGEFAAKNGDGNPACLGLRGATFETNLRLGGLWAVGRLLSKGYGLINADMQLGGLDVRDSHALSQ